MTTRRLRLERLEPRMLLAGAAEGLGLYDPGLGHFYLDDSLGGSTDRKFAYGPADPAWAVLSGDWDGDGRASVGLYDPQASVFHLKNANQSGTADVAFAYGPPGAGWIPIAGDWDRDGRASVGLYDPAESTWYLRNQNTTGVAQIMFGYGQPNAGWLPIAGDWNGDGTDTPGLHDPSAAVFYLKDTSEGGTADRTYAFGEAGAGWTATVGDWNGDGVDTPSLYDRDRGRFFLTNVPGAAIAETVWSYGPAGQLWRPVAGAWEGAGRGDPFTLVLMPDTQYYSAFQPEIFQAQTRWIDQSFVPDNIAMVSHVGDVVQNSRQSVQWENADAAMDALDRTGLIPYSVAPGNHDYQRASSHTLSASFTADFGESRYAGKSWYGGSSDDGANHFQVFDAGGRRWLHLALEFEPRPSTLPWAQAVLDAHPGMPTILSTHSYMSLQGRITDPFSTDGLSGEQLFQQFIRPNEQIFLVLCGHMNGERHQQSTNDAGQEVFELLADYQYRLGGDGYLQLLRFVPDENRIDVRTYSPWLDQWETDGNSQFSLSLDFHRRWA